jgi:phosphoglycerate dehydrogenase-like enzyme
MRYLNLVTILTLLLLPGPARAQTPAPTPEAARIISELGLMQAATPIAEHPDWQPRRIVVSIPARMSTQLPGFEQQMKTAAGSVELVIDRSDKLLPDAATLAGADAIIGMCAPPTLNHADKSLLWLHSYFVGMDRCATLPSAQLEGRVFTNNKRLSGPGIAQHSIAMLLSLAAGLPAYHAAQAQGQWDRGLSAQARFGEIQGKTLLVVGLGGIGTQVAWRGHGLGMRVIATRNSSREGPDYVDYVGLSTELDKLAAQADVVVNALPLTAATTGLFDKAFFDRVKPGAIFISVGRGKSTVTADLVAALQSGQLYGAGLDVTDPEPLPADSPLWQLPNVIITPHISGSGGGNLRRTTVIAAENLRRYVAGEPLLNIVDMRAGY